MLTREQADLNDALLDATYPYFADKIDLAEIRRLVALGADPNAEGDWGDAPLLLATTFGDVDAVRYLLDRGADLGVRRSNLDVSELNDADAARSLLYWAARSGSFELFRELEARGLVFDPESAEASDVVVEAAYSGAFALFRYLVEERGAKFDVSDRRGEPILFSAIFGGAIEIVRYLVERGAKLDVLDATFGETPAHYAALFGKTEIVRYFVDELGVDVDARDEDGATLLYAAVCGDSRPTREERSKDDPFPTVRFLVERGANLDEPNEKGESPVAAAYFCNEPEIARFLLKRGAKADVVSPVLGESILELALERGDFETFRYLIDERGVPFDVAFRSPRGRTLLHAAASGGRVDAIRFLLDAGAELEAKDERGRTPLFDAAGGPLNGGVRSGLLAVRYLIEERGADESVRDVDGQNVLRAAVLNVDVVRYLVEERGFEIDARSNDGSTFLFEAAGFAPAEVVDYLLERGADPNARRNDGATPATNALCRTYLDDVSERLLELADVRTRRSDGATFLRLAAECGGTLTVRRLIERGAAPDLNEPDDSGETPLGAAKKSANPRLIRFLTELGAVDRPD